MKLQRTIRELVTKDIFSKWEMFGEIEGAKYARKELRRLYFKYYPNLKEMEDRRLILWNLIVACRELVELGLESMNTVKIYSEQLKKDMDNTPDYKITDKHWYASMLSAYRDSHIKEMTKEELIELNKFCYDSYKKFSDPSEDRYIDMLVMKSNYYLSLEDYNTVLEVFESAVLLHTKKGEYESILNQMLEEIRNENYELYSTAKLIREEIIVKVI
jgi:hypothetical protein